MYLILENETISRFSDDTYRTLTIKFKNEETFALYNKSEAFDIRIPYLINSDYANVYVKCSVKKADIERLTLVFQYEKYSYRTVTEVRKDKINKFL
jgi:hypothetical protein